MPRAPSRTNAVIAAVRRKISSRALEGGEKLPSIRGLAQQMQVSPSTVVEAYDRLAAEGVIYARRGAGFFVSDTTLPFEVGDVGPQLARAIDPFWVSRQSLDADADAAKPGCGWLPADWMPATAIRRALRELARADDSQLLDYGPTQGAQDLRRLLARGLMDEGIEMSIDQVLLTPSGTQAIDLICRFLLRAGDCVVVDDPCYFNFQALLRAHRVRAIPVRFTSQGPDLEQFEQVLHQEKPRLYITNSGLHNPTGATLAPQVAHRVLSLARAHDVTLVEDDIFAGFEPEPAVRYGALDGLRDVIRIGSFSKTLSASVRCGYVAARPEWIAGLVDLQVATNFGGPSPIAAGVIHAALVQGSYRKHLDTLHQRLAKQRRIVASKLADMGIKPWLMPRGGFYLWCHLPKGVGSAALAQAGLAENLVLAPGNVFSASQSMEGFMRFNVSQMTEDTVFQALDRALAQVRST